ncbi:hypothetical protein HanRHA438_Chr16g0743381 [Helianthus annuus]|nr:hypothetical protein HanRHA438_Chr16g0743381 [Helianthus annuus]
MKDTKPCYTQSPPEGIQEGSISSISKSSQPEHSDHPPKRNDPSNLSCST